MSVREPPAISVLMPAYNASSFVLQSVQSVLAQTFEDFELIVVDDCSTDDTGAVLASINDRRLRVVTNEVNRGVVGSLNRAMAEATGHYVARIDADDFCLPLRLETQKRFLDETPGTLIVASGMSVLNRGRVRFSRAPADVDPKIVRWMLHVGNPVGHPAMMFRREVVTALGDYLREGFKYAEDFDFSHRVLRLGDISVLPEHLVIYRQHTQNLTVTRRSEMIVRTAAVLGRVYGELLGGDQDAAGALVAIHVFAGVPLSKGAELERLGQLLGALVERFCTVYELNGAQRRRVIAHAGKTWWHVIRQTLACGAIGTVARHAYAFPWAGESRPAAIQLAWSGASSVVRAWAPNPLHPALPAAAPPKPARRTRQVGGEVWLNGVSYHPVAQNRDDPPSLFVVVDTEAEFDWHGGFDSGATDVTAAARQHLAQAIFDRHGVRPIYVVDYAIASQPEGYEPLRAILDRHGCAIGAHLHPWINPPIEEEVSSYNSFAGNLPPELEASKLHNLVVQIEQSFHVHPLFFKAGRYGAGPNTMETLGREGIVVDFSIMPMTDFRPLGGPDFRFATAQPYRVGETRLLSVPMTRGQVGMIGPVSPRMHGALHAHAARRMHVPGILSRSGILNTVTLTPEGVTAEEQIQLIQAMASGGQRIFVLHYHSPSLGMHTPYVRNEAQLTEFLARIEAVCGYFFGTLGGMPGNPADLVPPSMRERVFPGRG